MDATHTHAERTLRIAAPHSPCAATLPQILVMMPFIQWYVFSKMAPTCGCCREISDIHNASAVLSPQCEDFRQEMLANEEVSQR